MAQQFPKDRFDVVPTDLERVGAHRAPQNRARGLLWLVWCLVAILVIVGAGWVYLHVLDRNVGDQSSPQPTITETVTPSEKATPKQTKSETPTPSSTPTMVPSTPISVLNGAGRAGLAAAAKAKLDSAGWTAVTTGNAPQSAPTTAVYYVEGQKGVALAVAQSLGLDTSTLQKDDSGQFATAQTPVTVVLGADYQG